MLEQDHGTMARFTCADAPSQYTVLRVLHAFHLGIPTCLMSAPVVRTHPRTPFEERYLAEARRICLETVTDPRYEIFLFGSRARGHCDHGSDVDIGIAGPQPLPGGTAHLLWLLTESDVPWRCQVVDFALVNDEHFRQHAYGSREIWRAAS